MEFGWKGEKDDRLWGMISFLLIICNNDLKKSILFYNRNFKYFIKAYILHYAVLNLLLTSPEPQGHFQTSIFLPCVTVDLEFFACAKKTGILFRWLLFKGDPKASFFNYLKFNAVCCLSPYTHSSVRYHY